jgi:uncharacterized protein (UPF0548 family)
MFLLTKPSNATIDQFLAIASRSDLTCPHIGASDSEPPPGYIVDHNRIELGRDWEAAKKAIREWRMFDFDWVDIFSKNTPIETGQNVAILIRHFGFYSLNAARIVYTVDKTDRFGFAYGTLEDHGESGEERFTVERDSEAKIWYDLKAFSKPNNAFAKLGYPVVRMLQKAFAEDSKQSMQRWTNVQV